MDCDGCLRELFPDISMKYKNGIEVQAGDTVLVQTAAGRVGGVVVKVVRSNTEDALQWSLPEGGLLIEVAGLGLWTTQSLEDDEDIVFVGRSEI
jgi:hypothetical protein